MARKTYTNQDCNSEPVSKVPLEQVTVERFRKDHGARPDAAVIRTTKAGHEHLVAAKQFRGATKMDKSSYNAEKKLVRDPAASNPRMNSQKKNPQRERTDSKVSEKSELVNDKSNKHGSSLDMDTFSKQSLFHKPPMSAKDEIQGSQPEALPKNQIENQVRGIEHQSNFSITERTKLNRPRPNEKKPKRSKGQQPPPQQRLRDFDLVNTNITSEESIPAFEEFLVLQDDGPISPLTLSESSSSSDLLAETVFHLQQLKFHQDAIAELALGNPIMCVKSERTSIDGSSHGSLSSSLNTASSNSVSAESNISAVQRRSFPVVFQTVESTASAPCRNVGFSSHLLSAGSLPSLPSYSELTMPVAVTTAGHFPSVPQGQSQQKQWNWPFDLTGIWSATNTATMRCNTTYSNNEQQIANQHGIVQQIPDRFNIASIKNVSNYRIEAPKKTDSEASMSIKMVPDRIYDFASESPPVQKERTSEAISSSDSFFALLPGTQPYDQDAYTTAQTHSDHGSGKKTSESTESINNTQTAQSEKVVKDKPLTPSYINGVNRDCQALLVELTPSPSETIKRGNFIARITSICVTNFPACKLEDFCGANYAGGDVDLMLYVRGPGADMQLSEQATKLGAELKEAGFRDVKILSRARIPMIKVRDTNSHLRTDITFTASDPTCARKLCDTYIKLDIRIKHLMILLRYWAKQRNIHDPCFGTLSAWALFNMAVFWGSTCKGPIVPIVKKGNEAELKGWKERDGKSLGECWIGVLKYYATQFPYVTSVCSTRTGTLISKDLKGWSKEKQRDVVAARDVNGIVKDRYWLGIEDPFEPSMNIARSTDKDSLYAIRGEFIRAAKFFNGVGSGMGMVSRSCERKEIGKA